MAYGDFEHLPRRTASDIMPPRDKAFNIAKNLIYKFNIYDIKEVLLQWFINFFDKKTAGNGAIKSEIMSNQELAEEIHKPITRKFEKRKVHSSFIDNIWGTGLADMTLISNYNKGICFLLCAIDILSKYAWVVPLKDKILFSLWSLK